MSLYNVSGIVLRRYPLGEADVIVHILSEERGKVEAVAKGARRTRSKLLAVTQPFVYARYMLFAGRSLDRLNQGEIFSSYRHLREDLDLFALCTFCSELVDKLLPVAEPSGEAFALLRGLFDYLHSLPKEELDLDNALTFFRLGLLAALGYKIDFQHCSSCGSNMGFYSFSFQLGGPLCSDCLGKDRTAMRMSPAVAPSLAKLSSLGWAKLGIIKLEPYADEIERLLEGFFLYHLELEPRSIEFWKSLRR